jgi:Lon protease-like protein
MSDEVSSLGDFRGTVRLFPLPNLVLFPYVIQPLHVFEPRYRQLMKDALEDDRLMALALLKPGWEEDYHKRPPLCPGVCIGKIFKEERLPDGRYNLLLHGLKRARIVAELPPDKAYRMARVEVLEDVLIGSEEKEQTLRKQLARQMTAWFAAQSPALEQLRKLLQSSLPLGTLGDVFAFALPVAVELKQELLEEANVERRIQRLLAHLENHDPPAVQSSSRRFPPDFSTN